MKYSFVAFPFPISFPVLLPSFLAFFLAFLMVCKPLILYVNYFMPVILVSLSKTLISLVR